MDRRKSLKILATGALAGTAALSGCKDDKKVKELNGKEPALTLDRNPDEMKNEKRLLEMEDIFTAHEMATITVLADIIIPADEVSGSASDAKVPEFIAFIVKDMPSHQVPMRGGLRWLDIQCMKQYEKSFKDCSAQQQIEMVDKIAYPDKAKPAMKAGVAFFSLI